MATEKNRKTRNDISKKRPRADSQRNRKAVALAVAKNPNATMSEIAKNTGLSKSTVQTKLNELGNIKDEAILGICDKDLEIVNLAQGIILDKLKDKKTISKMKASEVSQVAEASAKRYSLFRGSATDTSGGLNNPMETMSDADLLLLIKKGSSNETT
ncbi:MAG: MarR family transcriptional regulator [candidate division SR1 bacterium]|nr:MarR family transcriptional regulator [candidate division SR1 bacterium]